MAKKLRLDMDIEEITCPISKCIYKTPVIADDGFIYEREVINKWLENSRISPITRKEISNKLIECNWIKNKINTLLENNEELKELQYSPINYYSSNKKEVMRYINNKEYNKLLEFRDYILYDIFDILYNENDIDNQIMKYILENSIDLNEFIKYNNIRILKFNYEIIIDLINKRYINKTNIRESMCFLENSNLNNKVEIHKYLIREGYILDYFEVKQLLLLDKEMIIMHIENMIINNTIEDNIENIIINGEIELLEELENRNYINYDKLIKINNKPYYSSIILKNICKLANNDKINYLINKLDLNNYIEIILMRDDIDIIEYIMKLNRDMININILSYYLLKNIDNDILIKLLEKYEYMINKTLVVIYINSKNVKKDILQKIIDIGQDINFKDNKIINIIRKSYLKNKDKTFIENYIIEKYRII